MSYVGIIMTFVFVNNIVFSQLLGLRNVMETTKKMDVALGWGAAVVFVMTISALFASVFNTLIFKPLHIEFLRLTVFVLTTAALVQLSGLAIRKLSPVLARVIGVHLPHLAANCAVLGIVFLYVKADYSVFESVVAACAAGIGFVLANVLLTAVREKMNRENVPQALRGDPIAFISAGLMALAFMAFDAAFLKNIFG